MFYPHVVPWRAMALLAAAGLAALLLTSCAREQEPAPASDYSSPLATGPAPVSDYSSPMGGDGAEPDAVPPASEPRGPHTKPVDPENAPKVQVVGHGQEILVENYLVPGKTTILDFYSAFCPPCVAVAPHLQELVNQRDDLYLVTVDINRPSVTGAIDWGSPVSMQFTLRSIPHFKIYGPTGKIMLEGDPAYEKVIEWLKQVERPEQ